MTWKASSNQSPQSIRIVDIQNYFLQETQTSVSPIDRFYSSSQDLLRLGDIQLLTERPQLGSLLMVGIISVTENYFREILSQIIGLCPISKAESAEEFIQLGSVIWHDPINILKGAFEGFAFTASKNILHTCHKYTGIHLKSSKSILEEFDKVCQVRHGVVHSGLTMPGKNAVKLQIPSVPGSMKIKIGFGELQEAGAICTNVVTAVNQEFFVNLIKRWVEEWRELPSWIQSEEDELFNKIWLMFYSTLDNSRGLIANPLSVDQCLASVRLEYGL